MNGIPNVREHAKAKLPNPLVKIRVIERVLLNQAQGPLPEKRLVVAVICQALVDARCGDKANRRSALVFLLTRDLNSWAALVGLLPTYIRELALKTHYLLDGELTQALIAHNATLSDRSQGGADAGF